MIRNEEQAKDVEDARDENKEQTGILCRIIIFAMILPLQLLAVLLEPAWVLLCQVTHDLWQMAASSSHGMYATMALRMKENTKHGDDNERAN